MQKNGKSKPQEQTQPSSKDVSRPITLYVQEVKNSDLDHIRRDRVSVLDVEMSHAEAEQLLKIIQAKEKLTGAITFRLVGRLVLS